MKDLDVLFLAGLFPKEKEKEFRENSIGSIQNAANNLQWEIAEGLSSNLNKELLILNSPYLGSFPNKYKKIRIENFNFSHNGSSSNYNIGYFNLPGIKQLSRYHSIKPYVRKWALNGLENKVVIAYAMTSTFTHILKYIKEINPKVTTCLIVPDLPEYMRTAEEKSLLYSIYSKFNIHIIKKDMKNIDNYVLLTEAMNEKLQLNVPYVVVEGMSTTTFKNLDVPKKTRKTVLYSGGLEKEYGIINLIDSFSKLDNADYELIICGSGTCEEQIKEKIKYDKRIIFKGLVERKEAQKLQLSATLLVNPRPDNHDFTKFSFPSKILEYMSSGTPVLAYTLKGMPVEYESYIYSIPKVKDGLYLSLKSTLEKNEEELNNFGLLAKEFVLQNKNSIVQTKKILDMFN